MHVEVHDSLEPLLPAWGSLFAADPQASSGGRAASRLLRSFSGTVWNYWDIVASPPVREAVTEAVVGELRGRRGDWDVLAVNGLPPDSPTEAALARAGVRGRSPTPCPSMALPSTFDEYLGSLSRSHRGNLSRHLRRLESGEVELRDVRGREQISAAVDHWHDIRVRWWDDREKEMTALQRTERYREFIRDLVLELEPAGLAVVREMRRSDEVVGISINLRDERCLCWWTSGFDPSIAKLGPGKITIGDCIRTAIADGRDRFDFMVGTEPYKYWFGGTDRLRPRLVYGTSRPRSIAVYAGIAVADRRRGWSD